MKLCLGHFQLFHNCWYLSFYSELRLWVRRVVTGGDLVYSHPKNLSGAISFIVSSEKNFEKLKVREGAWLEREKGNCHRKQVGRLKGCIFYSSRRAILRHRVRIRATTLGQDDTNPLAVVAKKLQCYIPGCGVVSLSPSDWKFNCGSAVFMKCQNNTDSARRTITKFLWQLGRFNPTSPVSDCTSIQCLLLGTTELLG